MIESKAVIAPVMNNVKEYIGLYQSKNNDLTTVLSAAVRKYTRDIYRDISTLYSAMREFGATEALALKVCLMQRVSGFQEIIEIDERVFQNDIDRFVRNATNETGFNVKQVLDITSAVIVSLGMPALCDYGRTIMPGNETAGFVVPPELYESELKQLEDTIRKGQFAKLSPSDITRIEVLAKAGIPRAKCFLGLLLLNSDGGESSYPVGLRCLEEAAADGDSFASAELGDYYYNKADSDSWSKAIAYYTGYGATALGRRRKERVLAILNTKKGNIAIIVWSAILTLLMLGTVIIAPFASLFPPFRGWGIISVILCVFFIVIAILHYRIKPYDRTSWLPGTLFVLWSVYILIRIAF